MTFWYVPFMNKISPENYPKYLLEVPLDLVFHKTTECICDYLYESTQDEYIADKCIDDEDIAEGIT